MNRTLGKNWPPLTSCSYNISYTMPAKTEPNANECHGEIKTTKIMDEEEKYYSLTKKVFGILSPFYDIVTIPISRVGNKVVNFTNARSGSKILNVATGTGKQAFAFAKRGYDVIGVDLSEAMLNVGNKKNKYGNVKFEVADATMLPFEDNSFDVTCVSFALQICL